MKNYKDKIEKLISKMTPEEKTRLLCACSTFETFGCERLGIEGFKTMDGPHGVRPDSKPKNSFTWDDDPKFNVTALPVESALGASWNKELALIYGDTLGSEARGRGKDIILGPGVNMIRQPLSGRNFEYLAEDPVLAGELGKNLVKAIQKHDVAACVKHIALNNQELDRGGVNVKVSERALREIYLKAFHTAIIDGGALTVMGSTNKYNNEHCSHNRRLTKEILKDEWGFSGLAMTDWGAAHDEEQAIYNGLDLEMNTSQNYWEEYYLGKPFCERTKNNPKEMKLLDDKVRRILYVMFNINMFSPDRKKGANNTKEHQKAALDIAKETIVLLKNDDKILPLKKDKAKKILVMGENADKKHCRGGGSSSVPAYYEVTLLDGIKKVFKDSEIEYIESMTGEMKSIPVEMLDFANKSTGYRGFERRIHKDFNVWNGEYDLEYCMSPEVNPETDNQKGLNFVGVMILPEDGIYNIEIHYNGEGWVQINGTTMCSMKFYEKPQKRVISLEGKKGDRFEIAVTFLLEENGRGRYLRMGMTNGNLKSNEKETEKIIEKIKNADTVIYCGGLTHDVDLEGADKANIKLPPMQNKEIELVLKNRPDAVISLTAGTCVELPWIDTAKAVVWNQYNGMEAGNAFALTLCGDVNPSGKLPFTMPYKYEDTPVARYGEYKSGECELKEDIFLGYRGYEKDEIKPMFPFGHGLSYTEFEYSDLKIDAGSVKFRLKNTGTVSGKEAVQLYIGVKNTKIPHPVKELKDFYKIELMPNEEKTVEFTLTDDMFTYFCEDKNAWERYDGDFSVYIGSSVSDIRLKGDL